MVIPAELHPDSGPGPKILDPFADKVLPGSTYFSGMPKTNPCTQGPGIYNVDYRLANNQVCTLQAGLYVFTGSLSLNNTSKLLGTGVSLYFTCRTGTMPRACNSNGGVGESGRRVRCPQR